MSGACGQATLLNVEELLPPHEKAGRGGEGGHAVQFPMGARASTSTDRGSSGGSGSGLPPARSPVGVTAAAPAPAGAPPPPHLTAATATNSATTPTTGEDGGDSPTATPPAATQGGRDSQEEGISPGAARSRAASGATEDSAPRQRLAPHSTPPAPSRLQGLGKRPSGRFQACMPAGRVTPASTRSQHKCPCSGVCKTRATPRRPAPLVTLWQSASMIPLHRVRRTV